MLGRIVPFLLVAAIIACPLGCSVGLCDGGGCCAVSLEAASLEAASPGCGAQDHGARDHGAPNATLPACCSARASDDPSEMRNDDGERRDGPCPSPVRSSCQGVCGGAVFEKPYELDGPSDALFGSVADCSDAVVPVRALVRTVEGEHVPSLTTANPGRIVRLLHSSFLC